MGPNYLQVENNEDQVDCYQNVGTKLSVTLKYNEQKCIFT